MVLTPLWGEAATTSWPPWRRLATVFEPIRPVPPITTIFMVDPPLSLDVLTNAMDGILDSHSSDQHHTCDDGLPELFQIVSFLRTVGCRHCHDPGGSGLRLRQSDCRTCRVIAAIASRARYVRPAELRPPARLKVADCQQD